MIYFHFTPGSPQSPNTDGEFGKRRSSLLTAQGGRSKWQWEEEKERGEHSFGVANHNISLQPVTAVSKGQSSSEGPSITVTATWGPSQPHLDRQHEPSSHLSREVPSWHKPWHFPALVFFCSYRQQTGRTCQREIHDLTTGAQ